MFRFYRAPREWVTDPFLHRRSKMCQYVTSPAGTWWEWLNDGRPNISFGLVEADATTMALTNADTEIIPLSPEFADVSEAQSWLDGAHTGMTQEVKDQFETDGVNTDWVVGSITCRHIFRYLSRYHWVMQRIKGLQDADALGIFKVALTYTVSDVPLAARQRIAIWMTNNGLDTSWITGSTSVREVIHYILENKDWPRMPLGPVTI